MQNRSAWKNLGYRILIGLVVGFAMQNSAYADGVFVANRALPAEYRQVEYIQGDGTAARILTDYTPASGTDKIEAVVELATLDKAATIFCARGKNATTSTFSAFFSTSSSGCFSFHYYNNNSYALGAGLIATDTRYTVARDRNTYSLSGGGLDLSASNPAASFTAGNPVMIFASYYNGTTANLGNYSNYRLYSFKAWRSGQIVRDFIPCVRRSDGEVGLYDAVLCRFWGNANSSGAFAAGPAATGLQALPVFPVDFTGSAAVPEMSVVDAATGMPVDPSLYDVVYTDNTAVGTATASFSGRAGMAYEGMSGSAEYDVALVFRATGDIPAVEGDGQSWSSPMSWTNALYVASTSTVSCAVWLSGTCVLPVTSPTYTFRMFTALRGGFIGAESSPDERLPGARSVVDGANTVANCLVMKNNRKFVVDGIEFVRGKERGLRRESSYGELFVTNCGFIACGAGTTGRSGNNFATDGTGGRGLSIVGNGFGTARIVCSDISGNRLSGSGHDGGAGVAMLAHNLKRLYLESCNVETNTHNHWRGGSCQGVYAYNTPVTIEKCLFRGNTGWNANACALLLSGSCSGSVLRNCAFTGNFIFGAYGVAVVSLPSASDSVSVESCTFAYNYVQQGSTALRMVTGSLSARNCVFWKNVGNSTSAGTDIHLGAGASGSLDWICCTDTNSTHFSMGTAGSLSFGENVFAIDDPLFALSTADFTALPRTTTVYSSYKRMTFDDIAKIDVHPLSPAGYYNDAGEMLFSDGAMSPLIDAGDPEGDYSHEAGGNAAYSGGRLNMGAYGNTERASLTPYSRLDVANGPTVSFDSEYSQPTVTFTLGGEGAYVARAVVSLSTNGTDWVYSSQEMQSLTNGQTVVWLVPKYYVTGDPIQARVLLNSNTASFGTTGEVVTVTGNVPHWSEKGGDPSRVIHVRTGATGKADGTSWTDAMETLQQAYAAVTATRNEIWYSGTNYLASAPSSVTFSKELTIRGGFTAAENDPSERPDGLHSLIDGHDAHNSTFTFVNNAALTVERIDFMRARVYGAHRTGGTGNVTFIDCRFSCGGSGSTWSYNNQFFSSGGCGARMIGSSSVYFTAKGCDFSGNTATGHDVGNGGGLFMSNFKSAVLDGCTFMTNAPSGDSGWRSGSTVALGVYSTPLAVSNCVFKGNVNASPYAFGVCVYGACSNSVIRNSVFAGNTLAPSGSGRNGLLFAELSTTNDTMLLENCTFAYNFNRNGTAFNAYKGDFAVSNSIFHANVVSSTAGHGADIFCGASARVRVAYSMFDEQGVVCCSAAEGGELEIGDGCIYGDPLLATSTADFQTLTGNAAYPIGAGNFASLAARCSLDLHLLSSEGYWGNDGEVHKADGVVSPAIDAADPQLDVGEEPYPNGGVRNLGAYGGTAWASKTPNARPEVASGPTVSFEDEYTQPTVSFTVGGEGAFSATAVISISLDGGKSWAFVSEQLTSISNGDSVDYRVPMYFPTDGMMMVKVDVFASGSTASGTVSDVAVEGILPRWYGKGGGPNVVHVRPDATGRGDGTSWTDAVRDFHEGVMMLGGSRNELWISGTNLLANSSPTFAFTYPVTLRGGFDASENSPSERRRGARSVVDGGGTKDCFNFSNTAAAPVLLDSIVFVRGAYRATKKSGGGGDLTVTNCAFLASASAGNIEQQNYGPGVGKGGGGLSLVGDGTCRLLVADSEIAGNLTVSSGYDCGWGLAAYVYRFASARFENCNVTTNVLRFSRGGGCHGIQFYATPAVLERCSFEGNAGWNHGASVVAFDGACSNSVIRNCRFSGNLVHGTFGLVYVNMDSTNSTLLVENSTFAYNKCSGENSALSVVTGSAAVKNCVFFGNVRTSASRAVDVYAATNSRCRVSYSLFENGSTEHLQAGLGGIVETNALVFADPLFVSSAADFAALPKSTIYYTTAGLTISWLSQADAVGFNLHLRGRNGYYDESTGRLVTAFVVGPRSPAIDSGDPASDWSHGPDTQQGWHGKRVNLGAYGNTPWATMTPYPGTVYRLR